MSKKIVVDSCKHCPLSEYRRFTVVENDYVCTHPTTDGMEILDTSIIHPDCPLEENKRSCTCHD